ncbi:MAG: DNA polymerase III subunit gamma/tau [Planctomycetota bacterium]|jgi:DNA polymerase-3 subunit gamma/tau|nr:DNA polymerase III subunit gamma/tau [Planctomycetota bacterium]
MYEVMARRYRPATFAEVVGQEHIAATLKNAILRGRVAHAFLFAGGHGCGKTSMARIVAKALVCEKGPTVEPCSVCPICLDVAAGRDADVLEIDGASNNGIDQIRQLRDQAAYVPTRARFKIYIIDEAHMLSDSAFNALLKTLEEPPPHVKFILATTDPRKLPDTIQSRCQRFDFRLVPRRLMTDFLRRLAERENTPIADEALEAVASFSGGSVRDGLVLLDQLLSFREGEVTRQDVETVRGVASAENVSGIYAAIVRSDLRTALSVVDRVVARGTNVGDFLDQLISFGRDLMVWIASGSPEGIDAYGPARITLEELVKTVSLEEALLYLDVLSQARIRVRARSLSNPLVILEIAVVRLAGLGGLTPMAKIIDRLGSGFGTIPSSPPPKRVPLNLPAERKTFPARPELKESAPEPEPPTTGEGRKMEAGPDSGSETAGPREAGRDEWERVLRLLSQSHPAYFRYTARLEFLEIRDDKLRLTGPPFTVEAWGDPRRQAHLAEAVAGVFGRPLELDFVVRTGEPGPDAPGRDLPLLQHPSVGIIKRLFDGVVVNFQAAPPTGEALDAAGGGME